jgi:hypothetical protein
MPAPRAPRVAYTNKFVQAPLSSGEAALIATDLRLAGQSKVARNRTGPASTTIRILVTAAYAKTVSSQVSSPTIKTIVPDISIQNNGNIVQPIRQTVSLRLPIFKYLLGGS